MLSDSALLTFKAISTFINCLNEVFGKDHRSLKLYSHLINKTTLSNEKPIIKHIDSFRTFCTNNRNAIFSKDISKFSSPNITYSKRVYINIVEIFQDADFEASTIIWKHLLTISALCDPTGKARQILEERTASKKDNGEGGEEDFLKNIIGKVEEHVDPNANPMEAVSSIMKSGIFSELVGGMGNGLENGTLDLSKLMGTVQTMVSTLNDQANQDGAEGGEAVNMINKIIDKTGWVQHDPRRPSYHTKVYEWEVKQIEGPYFDKIKKEDVDKRHNNLLVVDKKSGCIFRSYPPHSRHYNIKDLLKNITSQ